MNFGRKLENSYKRHPLAYFGAGMTVATALASSALANNVNTERIKAIRSDIASVMAVVSPGESCQIEMINTREETVVFGIDRSDGLQVSMENRDDGHKLVIQDTDSNGQAEAVSQLVDGNLHRSIENWGPIVPSRKDNLYQFVTAQIAQVIDQC